MILVLPLYLLKVMSMPLCCRPPPSFKGAPGLESWTGPRLVSPGKSAEKIFWTPLQLGPKTLLSFSSYLWIFDRWYWFSPPDHSEITKSYWEYIFFSWLSENAKISEIFEELSSVDAFRTQILTVCGKCHCMSHWQQHRLTGSWY